MKDQQNLCQEKCGWEVSGWIILIMADCPRDSADITPCHTINTIKIV
jgi:hypothetical protein